MVKYLWIKQYDIWNHFSIIVEMGRSWEYGGNKRSHEVIEKLLPLSLLCSSVYIYVCQKWSLIKRKKQQLGRKI